VRAPGALRLSHRGEFNLSSDRPAWRPFESRQWTTTRRPGFVWSARIGTSPMPIDVIDAYVDGDGLLDARLWGMLPLSHAEGTREMARGELMRWLAEAVHAPWTLTACPGLRWQAVDARHADATLVDSPSSATLRFEFGDDGLIAAVRSEARPRLRGRATVETPWAGRWRDYAWRDGALVPTRGEVEWIVDGRAQPYWRGELVACDRLELPDLA